MDVNKVIIAGNLTRDPEFKNTNNNKQFTRFSIASNRSFKNANGERQKETLFTNVVAWGGQAETCSKYLRKGNKVLVVGRLSSREFDGADS
jgi:single-strand DNA-binding protein